MGGYSIPWKDRLDSVNGDELGFFITASLSFLEITLPEAPNAVLEVLAVRVAFSSGWVSLLLCYNHGREITVQGLQHYIHQLLLLY